jgi:hypothetical protein
MSNAEHYEVKIVKFYKIYKLDKLVMSVGLRSCLDRLVELVGLSVSYSIRLSAV